MTYRLLFIGAEKPDGQKVRDFFFTTQEGNEWLTENDLHVENFIWRNTSMEYAINWKNRI